MLEKYKITSVGLCTFDKLVLLDTFPHENDKLIATEALTSLGGPATNLAIILIKLGISVPLITSISFDQKIKEELAQNKIILDGISLSHQSLSKVYIMINRKNGSRTAIAEIGATLCKLNEKQKAILGKTEIIYIEGGVDLPIISEIFNCSLLSNSKIFYNLEFYSKERLAFFKQAHYSIMSKQVADSLIANSNYAVLLQELWTASNQLIGVTLGEKGSIFFDGAKLHYQPIYKTETVDTTGAGDAFQSGLLLGIVKGWDISTTAKIASIMASLNCTVYGASNYPFNIQKLISLSNEWKCNEAIL